MMYTTVFAPNDRDLATLADLIELAGSATLVRTIAAAIAAEKGRTPLVKDVVDRILELRREAVEEALEDAEAEVLATT